MGASDALRKWCGGQRLRFKKTQRTISGRGTGTITSPGSEARGGRGLGKIAELTPPNGWRAGLVCRVLSAEPVLRRPIYQTLFKRGVGAALVAAQRRSLQTPRRILSLRGTRT